MANPYFWYEEDFTSFLLSLDLPAYRKNKPLYDVIKEEKNYFYLASKRCFRLIDSAHFQNRFIALLMKSYRMSFQAFNLSCELLKHMTMPIWQKRSLNSTR